MPDAPRPDFAPENRSPNAGKFIAVLVFALLLAGAAASLVVVLTRGSRGIEPGRGPVESRESAPAPAPQPD